MVIIVENQSEEWRNLRKQLLVAQANHDRYSDAYCLNWEILIDWEKLNQLAVQATPEEISSFFAEERRNE